MIKTYTLLLTLLLCLMSIQAKESRIFGGLGYAYHNFQDTRYTDQQFTNFGIQPELGFTLQQSRNTFSGLLTAYTYSSAHPVLVNDSYTINQIDFRLNYTRTIIHGFQLGLSWDVFDYTEFNQPSLNNSSKQYILTSDGLIALNYSKKLNHNLKINAGLDFGILSFVKMAPGFTTNIEEEIVNGGDLNYQDLTGRNPFELRYFDPKPFWEQLYLRSTVEVFYKKRLSVAYLWRMRTLWDQWEYPVTNAGHNFSFRFHFMSQSKNQYL